MKKLTVIPLLGLLLLMSCDAPDEVPEGQVDGGTITTLCNEKSANCDMKWLVQYPKTNFPQTIEILVDNKVVYNECRDTDYYVNRASSTVEIIMYNFVRLKDKKTKFSFHVKRIPDCNEPKKSSTFSHNDPQLYSLEEIEGEDVVLIKN